MNTLKKMGCLVTLGALVSTMAFGWGNATHTYFAKKLGAKVALANMQEMYGAVLPDVFNYVFDQNGAILADQTHHNFMPFVLAAQDHCALKATAFGFACHNDVWGADWTAHHQGFGLEEGLGWIIMKTDQFAPSLVPDLTLILENAGLDEGTASAFAAGIAPTLGEDLLETAVDIMMKRNEDPRVGSEMLTAAQTRKPDVGLLLASVYAGALSPMPESEAKALIVGAEGQFHSILVNYGKAFCVPEPMTIKALAAFDAPIAEAAIEGAVFQQAGIPIDVTVSPSLVESFLEQAVNAVKDDYASQISQTLAYLTTKIADEGITTCGPAFAIRNGENNNTVTHTIVPRDFSLGCSYPNPFNPATRISYALPVDAKVVLKVYSSIGQEVATLVDGERPAGSYDVTWNAATLASGVYFYQIRATGENSRFVETKKMILTK